MRFSNTQKGFTLIELVVATALFSVVISAILGIYFFTLKINRRTDATRTAAENARFFSEFVTKEIRNGQLDYTGPAVSPCSTGISGGGVSSLAILNIDGDHECIYLSGTNIMFAKMSQGRLLAAVQLNDSKVKVAILNFFISPAVNPYASGAQDQPQVTLSASFNVNPDPQDSVTI